MSVPDRPARRLAARPDLDQQRKLARELLRALHARDPEALRRVREHHPRFVGAPPAALAAATFALHDAQLVLAREYGFASWPRLKAHIDALSGARLTRPFVRELGYYEARAAGLLAMHAGGLAPALEQIRAWHPRLGRTTDEDLRAAPFGLDDARLVYARQHGCESWGALARLVEDLAAGRAREPFAEAFEALRDWDPARLDTLLAAHPELILARGTNGNTLLNLAASLSASAARPAGVEPLVFTRRLLAAGADPDGANDRGWTPLHQAAYSDQRVLVDLLVASGAAIDMEAHGEGGTPLAVALFWGHHACADRLALGGIAPRNLRIAAGLGREELVRECFCEDGTLAPGAKQGRGFYRPHSGFPVWHASGSDAEVLDEALVWAARNDRAAMVPLLVARGARLDADPYRGTPLCWAAFSGAAAAARALLDLGASVNQRAGFGGPSHGQGLTALHLAAQNDRVALVELLLERGADPALEDELYHGTAEGWAEHHGARESLRLLRARRLGGSERA